MEDLEYPEECIFCGVPLMGGDADKDKPQVCVMCTDSFDHVPSETGDTMKPKVLVEVENGLATATTIGDVEVLIVDYDVLDMGESQQIPEAFYEVFAGLREAVSTRGDEQEVSNEKS
jgi:hypothetical protein